MGFGPTLAGERSERGEDSARETASSVPLQCFALSENVVYPIVPHAFADHDPVFKWLAIIGNINPTFSKTNPYFGL